ncbi:MAG: class I SAM-dependent methyltransferase [Candidatus Omnitrophica bacterium]|nr:class I SAM-dependent methyltransferase [Candidatus Omnitrophota bacterium]
MSFNRKDHWEKVYTQKSPLEVSWYQAHPVISLDLIVSTEIDLSARIIDVGAGASVLVDKLLEAGYKDITVLDISSKAIDHAKERLGNRAEQIMWLITDITEFEPSQQYDLWHDRAVFHFLTDTIDRREYIGVLKKSLKPGGHLILSAFSLEGPPKCSGLQVERYDIEKMQGELGDDFEFIASKRESHATPWQAKQEFIYCHFKKK